MNHLILVSCIILSSIICTSLSTIAQPPLFQSDELIEIRLIIDIPKLQADRIEYLQADDDLPEHEAQLIQKLPDGSDAITDLQVSIRGNYRRKPQICTFPPLLLDFRRKKDPPPGPFEGQNKLKLVTHCEGSDYVQREHLVYKLYNLFTEYSFRVRLAKITYEDINGEVPPQEEFGFFIEDDNAMADRLGGEDIPDSEIKKGEVDRELLTFLHVFQCMIGNLDWDISLNKNVEILSVKEKDKPIVVPFDFDFSELVNAPYTNVGDMERQVFRELCGEKEEITTVLNQFREKEDEVFDLVKSSEFVKGKSRKEVMSTLKAFYKKIDDTEAVVNSFQASCE